MEVNFISMEGSRSKILPFFPDYTAVWLLQPPHGIVCSFVILVNSDDLSEPLPDGAWLAGTANLHFSSRFPQSVCLALHKAAAAAAKCFLNYAMEFNQTNVNINMLKPTKTDPGKSAESSEN